MLKNKKCLTFQYSHNDALKDALSLNNLLLENNINFVYYNDTFRQLFKIDKGSMSWNCIMELINSVKPSKYIYVYTCIIDNTEYNI